MIEAHRDDGARRGGGPSCTVELGLADPKIGEREVLVLLAGKGFSGKEFQKLTESHGVRLLRPDRKDETYRNSSSRSCAGGATPARSRSPRKPSP